MPQSGIPYLIKCFFGIFSPFWNSIKMVFTILCILIDLNSYQKGLSYSKHYKSSVVRAIRPIDFTLGRIMTTNCSQKTECLPWNHNVIQRVHWQQEWIHLPVCLVSCCCFNNDVVQVQFQMYKLVSIISKMQHSLSKSQTNTV